MDSVYDGEGELSFRKVFRKTFIRSVLFEDTDLSEYDKIFLRPDSGTSVL